jgi:hypothetical protein
MRPLLSILPTCSFLIGSLTKLQVMPDVSTDITSTINIIASALSLMVIYLLRNKITYSISLSNENKEIEKEAMLEEISQKVVEKLRKENE